MSLPLSPYDAGAEVIRTAVLAVECAAPEAMFANSRDMGGNAPGVTTLPGIGSDSAVTVAAPQKHKKSK
jgi:hypothetical protein